MNDPDNFLRELLVNDAVGGPDGAQRLVDAARAGDRATIVAALTNTPAHVLTDLAAQMLVQSVGAYERAIANTSALILETLADIRDHGGSLDDAIAGMAAMIAGLGVAQQDSPGDGLNDDGGIT